MWNGTPGSIAESAASNAFDERVDEIAREAADGLRALEDRLDVPVGVVVGEDRPGRPAAKLSSRPDRST
jgi:hypothetical protein